MMIGGMFMDESNIVELNKLSERDQSLIKNRAELTTLDAQRKVDEEKKIIGNKELALCIMKERAKRRDVKALKEGKRLYHNLVEDIDDFDEVVNEVQKLSYLDRASIFCVLVSHRDLNDIRVVAK